MLYVTDCFSIHLHLAGREGELSFRPLLLDELRNMVEETYDEAILFAVVNPRVRRKLEEVGITGRGMGEWAAPAFRIEELDSVAHVTLAADHVEGLYLPEHHLTSVLLTLEASKLAPPSMSPGASMKESVH